MDINHDGFTQKYTKVICEDTWKFNAPHQFYVAETKRNNIIEKVHFQEGPIKEYGINGVSNEDLLLMVVTRLEAFQKSEYKCEENQRAIDHLMEAVEALRDRTNKRIANGTEGTSAI